MAGPAAADFPGHELAAPDAAAGWRRAGRRAWEARARGQAELTRPGSGRRGAGVRSGCASRACSGALGGRVWGGAGLRSTPGGRKAAEVSAGTWPGGSGHLGPGLQGGPRASRGRVGSLGTMPEAPTALRSRPTPAAAQPRRCWPRRGGGSGRGLEQLRAGPGLWGQGQLRSGVSEQPPGPQVSPCPLPTLHFSSPQWAWCPFAAEGAPRVEEGCGGERRDRWLRGRGLVRQGSRY